MTATSPRALQLGTSITHRGDSAVRYARRKRCSRCGWIDAGLTLSNRVYHCAQCGLVLDRDLNAAINLEKLAGSSSDNHNACGVTSSGTKRKPGMQLAAKKQELNAEHGQAILG
jgi:putative transposase